MSSKKKSEAPDQVFLVTVRQPYTYTDKKSGKEKTVQKIVASTKIDSLEDLPTEIDEFVAKFSTGITPADKLRARMAKLTAQLAEIESGEKEE